MKLQIDFYSKEELAIQMDFSGRYPMPQNQASELFLFACFTLRQLRNLGQHLTAKALAGLLVRPSSTADLMQGATELPSGQQLLFGLQFHAISVVSKSQGPTESMKATLALQEQFRYSEAIMQALDREILSALPTLVPYRGQGKKSFEATLPPFRLDMKGFGILGLEVNHHAFHSVVGLIRFLGQKHGDSDGLRTQLSQVAVHCGSAYVFNQIPLDQVALANSILKEVGIA